MTLAVMAYGNQSQPHTALVLPANQKALRVMLAGPILFNRQRAYALLGGLYRLVKDGAGASCATVASFGRVAVLKVFHARNDFFGTIRDQVFAVLRRCGFLGANERQAGAAVFLGHGDGGCRAGNQNKARDGHGDFATGGSAHDDVSLALINRLMLVLGRGVSRVPLAQILRAHCAEKRDQLWGFRGALRANPPQLHRDTRNNKTSFLNASLGDHLRRVAHHDGLAYVRRNPIFDGDTAR